MFMGSAKASFAHIVSQPPPIRTSRRKALLLCGKTFRLQPCQPRIELSNGSPFLEGLDVRDTEGAHSITS